MAYTVEIKEVNYQTGTDNKTVYVYWKWKNDVVPEHTDSYEIQWFYTTGDGYRFEGSSDTVKESSFNQTGVVKRTATYSVPENATHVLVNIKPVAEKRKDNKTNSEYYVGSWTTLYDFVISKVDNLKKPTVPSTPSIEMKEVDYADNNKNTKTMTMIITLTDYKDSENASSLPSGYDRLIEYYLYNGTKPYSNTRISPSNIKETKWSLTSITLGGKYRVRARAVIRHKTNIKRKTAGAVSTYDDDIKRKETEGIVSVYDYEYEDVETSDWSAFSEEVITIPAASNGFQSGYPKAYASKDPSANADAAPTAVELVCNEIPNATGYEIEYTTDKYLFGISNEVQSDRNEGDPDRRRRIISGLETGKTWYFRCRGYNEQGEGAWGDSSLIKSVTIGKAPSAPSTWSSTNTAIWGDSVRLYWTHNTQDNSTQTAAQIYLSFNGTSQTINVDSNASSFALSISSTYTTDIMWKVRTKGMMNAWSPWSVTRTLDVYSKPSVSIYLESTTCTKYPYNMQFISHASGQYPISYNIEIVVYSGYDYWMYDQNGGIEKVQVGDLVYSKVITTSNQDVFVEIMPSDVVFHNNTTYKLTVTVGYDSGLTAAKSKTFKVALADTDYRPNASIGITRTSYSQYDDNYSVKAQIAPFCTDSNGEYPDVTLSVYRINEDGSLTEIIKNISNDTHGNHWITDPHPTLSEVRYRIISIDNATGSVEYYDMPAYSIYEKAIILTWDEVVTDFISYGSSDALAEQPAVGRCLRLPYNIDISDNMTADVSLVSYIGRSNPVSYYGTQIGHTATWNVEIPKDDTYRLMLLRHLSRWMGDVYVREPSGSGYWAQVGVSFSQKHREVKIPVTLSIKRVEGEK